MVLVSGDSATDGQQSVVPFITTQTKEIIYSQNAFLTYSDQEYVLLKEKAQTAP